MECGVGLALGHTYRWEIRDLSRSSNEKETSQIRKPHHSPSVQKNPESEKISLLRQKVTQKENRGWIQEIEHREAVASVERERGKLMLAAVNSNIERSSRSRSRIQEIEHRARKKIEAKYRKSNNTRKKRGWIHEEVEPR